MAIIQAILLLTSALLTSGQRPSFAGSRPIGYPELTNRTTTPSALVDKFGEGTTERLPIEAQGDRELVDRLSKLPLDKQPFWFINWKANEANRNKPQTYPQRPNPFLEGNLQNPEPINTNPSISNANVGGNMPAGPVNTNPPQPVMTNPVNTDNVNNGVKPPTSNINAGKGEVNIKSGDSELGNRFATESTTFVSTTVISGTSPVIQDPVKSNDEADNYGNAKKTKLTVVPLTTSNLNDRNIAPISIPYYKDVVTFDSDNSNNDQEVVQYLNNDSNTQQTEFTNVTPYINKNNENINTVVVPDHSDTIKISNNDNFQLVESQMDTNVDRDIQKPNIKVNHGLTDTNLNFPMLPRRKSLGAPTEDDYEDIEVKKVIKLYPGIIPLYQR